MAYKDPLTTAKVQKQMLLVKRLINRNSESPLNEALRRLAKAAKSTIHKILLLDQEIKEFHTVNAKQKQKRITPRSYLASGGVLTGAKGQQLAQNT